MHSKVIGALLVGVSFVVLVEGCSDDGTSSQPAGAGPASAGAAGAGKGGAVAMGGSAQGSGGKQGVGGGAEGGAVAMGGAPGQPSAGAPQGGAGEGQGGAVMMGGAGAPAGGQSASAGQTGSAGQVASGGGPAMMGEVVTYGQSYEGGEFHLGPVNWEEQPWHNACAPGGGYAPAIRQLEGNLLAGIWGGIADTASYCDACIHVQTAMGKSAVLRVVTYGDTTPNSIDVSPEAYALLDSGEYPRLMTWQFARCPDTGKVMYEFQTGSSEWWTSLWVRNARVPLAKVEVQSANHAEFVALERAGDGTLNDGGGFGNGPFTLRLTGVDGQVVTDTFEWPGDGIAGKTLTGQGNFE